MERGPLHLAPPTQANSRPVTVSHRRDRDDDEIPARTYSVSVLVPDGGALRVIYEADWASPRRIAYRGVLGAIPARAKLPSVSIEHS